jgi:FkbM family methyltransferase
VIGKVIRLPLRLIPPDFTVRIVFGPLRGYKWVVGSGLHSVWLGTYEARKIEAVRAVLKPGDTFYDIGAHAGVYTLAASSSVGDGGTIIAVEPDALNAQRFTRHMSLNLIPSVRLIQAAASETAGEALFSRGSNGYENRLDATGNVRIRTIRLDDLKPSPSVIKIDVEGHEASVLRGATRILAVDRPIIFVATHSSGAGTECNQILESSGYAIEWLEADELIARPRRPRD